jgi:long-chain acyl-CoA synthetase
MLLAAAVDRGPDEPALGFIRAGELHWRTWKQLAADVEQLANVLRAAGVEPGDRIAQVSENRHEWIVTDLAIHLAGAVHVPVHVTLSGQQIAQQITDCSAKLAFVSNKSLLAKFSQLIAPDVKILIHDDKPSSPSPHPPSPSPQPPAPSDLATILYTSGTAGRPRGVMLTQRNLASNAAAMASTYGDGADQSRLCILPLSHIYARTCDLYTWVYRGSRLILAESRETLARDLQLARPTALNAVPFVYQRIADQIRTSGCDDNALALRQFLGGRMEKLSCGGAPLAPDVERWYAGCGLPILAGYGLTEASPVIAASSPTAHRPGSVGRALAGVEIRLAPDGEILARGPNVMRGYWQDEAATKDTIRDGWLHTGDLGENDADGFLHIRGRKKEVIVLSTGKKVLPTRVENLLTASPLIEQAAVFGEGQPGLVALIVLTSKDGPAEQAHIAAEIERCLQAAAREEQVRRFAILGRPFSIERGELTPKHSLCRPVIAKNFADVLNALTEMPQIRNEHCAERA